MHSFYKIVYKNPEQNLTSVAALTLQLELTLKSTICNATCYPNNFNKHIHEIEKSRHLRFLSKI